MNTIPPHWSESHYHDVNPPIRVRVGVRVRIRVRVRVRVGPGATVLPLSVYPLSVEWWCTRLRLPIRCSV